MTWAGEGNQSRTPLQHGRDGFQTERVGPLLVPVGQRMSSMSTKFLPVAMTASVLAVAATSASAISQYQAISLDAASGDSSVTGHAQLDVTRAHGGFRVRGTVTAYGGCVELKLIEDHWGLYTGGDTVTRVCGQGHQVVVSAFTHHSDVVLTADIGPGYDSRIVQLTGTGG